MTRLLATAALALFLAATPVAAAVPTSGTPVEPPIEGLAEAHAAVLASGAPFEGFPFRDSALIGGSAWWEAYEIDGGWTVVYSVGWGDCPAGCISTHEFVYTVDTLTGAVTYEGDTGELLPANTDPAIAALVTGAEVPADEPASDNLVLAALLLAAGAALPVWYAVRGLREPSRRRPR
jgi:hypothetical protein